MTPKQELAKVYRVFNSWDEDTRRAIVHYVDDLEHEGKPITDIEWLARRWIDKQEGF